MRQQLHTLRYASLQMSQLKYTALQGVAWKLHDFASLRHGSNRMRSAPYIPSLLMLTLTYILRLPHHHTTPPPLHYQRTSQPTSLLRQKLSMVPSHISKASRPLICDVFLIRQPHTHILAAYRRRLGPYWAGIYSISDDIYRCPDVQDPVAGSVPDFALPLVFDVYR
jgi:hypothetical protein